MMKISSLFMCVAMVFAIGAGAAEKPLTNDDVIALTKAGIDSSTIRAKIAQSGHSGFDTSVDGLIKLKKAGVAKEVVDAMLGVTTGAAPLSPSSVRSDVQLLRAEGPVDLESLQGESSATYIGIGYLMWLNFQGQHAAVRANDQEIILRLRSSQRPDSRVFIVRLDVNDNDRSVKMGRSRMFSATAPSSPDREWTFPFESVQEGEGVWKITVKKPLGAGEYGLLRGTELFDFGVD